MNEHPIAKVCPSCGSAAFQRVRVEKGIVAFADDRRCRECGMRYTPPTPAWAAVLFIAVGGFILVAYLGLIFGATARGMPLWEANVGTFIGAFTVLPVSVGCVRYGLRKLKQRSAEHGRMTRHEVGTIPTPKVGPPDDDFMSRAPAKE